MSEKKEPIVLDQFAPSETLFIKGPDGKKIEIVVNESKGGEEYWKWYDSYTQAMAAMAPGKDVEDDSLEQIKRIGSTAGTFDALQVTMICQCVTVNGMPIDRGHVQQWGNKCRQGVFEVCQRVNGLTKATADEQVKSSPVETPSGTGTTSPQN